MKSKLFFFVIFLAACTSKEMRRTSDYEAINELWMKNGSIEDLKNRFGRPEVVNDKIAEYMFPNSRVPKMHFQFDSEGKLESALLFLDQKRIKEFKNFIGCEWIEKSGKNQTADFIDKTYEGQCKNKPIRFNYFSSLNSYQIWWNKK